MTYMSIQMIVSGFTLDTLGDNNWVCYSFECVPDQTGSPPDLKKVRRGNEVPKKWDFDFGYLYLSQNALF